MLCESRLWIMTHGQVEEVASLPPEWVPQNISRSEPGHAAVAFVPARAGPMVVHGVSPEKTCSKDWSLLNPSVTQNHVAFHPSALNDSSISLMQAQGLGRAQLGRRISPEVEIPGQDDSDGDVPFLVPSFCQSICQNYSDLHIRGDQVLPLSESNGEHLLCADIKAIGPFLQSCDVLPAADDSLPEQTSQAGQFYKPIRRSSHWRQGSGRDRSFLLQGREGPFTNSLLNCYLEHKLLDLYQQYMLENMSRVGTSGSDSNPVHTCPLLASELILTSLDQITLQLSQEGNLEAGLAKDMVISCLLRVASDMQSGEISTPILQFSNEESRAQLTDDGKDQDAFSSSETSVKEIL